MAEYYEMSLKHEKDSRIASSGALMANSYAKKGENTYLSMNTSPVIGHMLKCMPVSCTLPNHPT